MSDDGRGGGMVERALVWADGAEPSSPSTQMAKILAGEVHRLRSVGVPEGVSGPEQGAAGPSDRELGRAVSDYSEAWLKCSGDESEKHLAGLRAALRSAPPEESAK